MPNYMIVNPQNDVYLAVTASPPVSGSEVKMLKIGESEKKAVSAFWTIAAVEGGYKISLASNPDLYLDIDATNSNDVTNGTKLIVTSSHKFYDSNLWIVGQLSAPTLGETSQIESSGTAGDFVIDAGRHPQSQVYQDVNSFNQKWQLLSLK